MLILLYRGIKSDSASRCPDQNCQDPQFDNGTDLMIRKGASFTDINRSFLGTTTKRLCESMNENISHLQFQSSITQELENRDFRFLLLSEFINCITIFSSHRC